MLVKHGSTDSLHTLSCRVILSTFTQITDLTTFNCLMVSHTDLIFLTIEGTIEYLLKARTVEPEKQLLLGKVCKQL
jgi:hypothetical protein